MKKRIPQIAMILCGFGVLIGLMLPRMSGGGPSKIGTAQTDVRNLREALNQYHLEFGEYPPGENARVLEVLLGENSRKIKLFDASPKRFNSHGQFLDPWKTPYQIQIFEKTNSTIRSAGPNRSFGDDDDITNLNR